MLFLQIVINLFRTRIKARCHYKLSSGTDSFWLDSVLSCAKMCSKCVREKFRTFTYVYYIHIHLHMVDDISFVCSIHNKYLENGTYFVCLIVSGIPDIISLSIHIHTVHLKLCTTDWRATQSNFIYRCGVFGCCFYTRQISSPVCTLARCRGASRTRTHL